VGTTEGTAADAAVRSRRPSRGAAALLAYSALALVRYWPVVRDLNGRVAAPGGDTAQYVFGLGWMAHVLTSPTNPFFTDYVNHPAGANVLDSTTTPLFGFLFAPVTLLVGPIASYNLSLVVGFATTAFATYLLVARWVGSRPVAFAAGLLFVLSGYLLCAGIGHPNLSAVALLPLILLCLDELLLRRPASPIPWGVALGLLVVAQFFLSSEMLADTAELVVVAGLVALVVARRELVERVRAAATGLAVASVIAVVGLAYPAWYAVLGPQHVQQHVEGSVQSVDLISPFVPSSNQLLAPARLQEIGDGLSGGAVVAFGHTYVLTHYAYVGLPALLLAGATIVRRRRDRAVQALTALAAFAFLLALGPSLKIDDHDTGIPLPAKVFSHLPVLRSTAPERFVLFTLLAVVVLAAMALRDVASSRGVWRLDGRGAAAVLGAVAIAAVVPVSYFSLPVGTPEFFAHTSGRVPDGAVAVTYPFASPAHSAPMLWQAEAQLRFKLVGGYVFIPGDFAGYGVPGASTTKTTLDRYLSGAPAPPPDAALVQAVRSDLAGWGVDVVVVDPREPGAQAAVALFTAAVGRASEPVGGVELWTDVRASLRAG
jgi:hypothetical protein